MTKLDKYLKEVEERLNERTKCIYSTKYKLDKVSADIEALLKIIEELKGQRNEAIVEASYRDYDNCEDMHILDADLEIESLIPETEGE